MTGGAVIGLLLVCWGAVGVRREGGRRRRWWAIALGLLCPGLAWLLLIVSSTVRVWYLVGDLQWATKTIDPRYALWASMMLLPGGAFLLWRGLRGECIEGDLRCPRCDYDMRSHVPDTQRGSDPRQDSDGPTDGAIVCTHCGCRIEEERDLYCFRPHWGMAAVGLLLLLQYTCVRFYVS